jgi:hypothetical protein
MMKSVKQTAYDPEVLKMDFVTRTNPAPAGQGYRACAESIGRDDQRLKYIPLMF